MNRKNILLFLMVAIPMYTYGQTIAKPYHTDRESMCKETFGSLGSFLSENEYRVSPVNRNQKNSNSDLAMTSSRNRSIDSLTFYMWDTTSMQLEKVSKYTYSFDFNRNPSGMVVYSATVDKKRWKPSLKNDLSYVGSNLMVETSSYWDPDLEKWNPHTEDRYDYNNSSNLELITNYNWNSTLNIWDAYTRSVFTYKSDTTYDISLQYLDKTSDIWKNISLEEIDLNRNGDELSKTISLWDEATGWQPSNSSESEYNAQGLEVRNTSYLWNESENRFIGMFSNNFVYDNEGNLLQEFFLSYNEVIKAWKFDSKTSYTYDSQGNLIDETYSSWNDDLIQWIILDQTENSFDENGNQIGQIRTFYKKDGSFHSSHRYESDFDLNYSYSDLVLPPYETYSFLYTTIFNAPLEKRRYNMDKVSHEYELISRYQFFYSNNEFTDLQNTHALNANVYPNPAGSHFTITFEDSQEARFELFDIQGNRMLVKDIFNGEDIDVSMLSTGLYFYRLTNGYKNHTGKLVKQ
jgi:hypothetical protein